MRRTASDTRLKCLAPTLTPIDVRIARTDKQVDAVYTTPEHRKWSRAVIRRAGSACQSCGRTGCRLFADHIVEIKDRGAALDLANGQALCGRCHSIKTSAERSRRASTRHVRPGGGSNL